MNLINKLIGNTITVLHPSDGCEVKVEKTGDEWLEFVSQGELGSDIDMHLQELHNYAQIGTQNEVCNETEWQKKIQEWQMEWEGGHYVMWAVEYDMNMTHIKNSAVYENLEECLVSDVKWIREVAGWVKDMQHEMSQDPEAFAAMFCNMIKKEGATV